MPERWLFWRERDSRLDSWVISEGKVPEMDLETRVIEVTCPEEPQLMPCHLQGLFPDQLGGGGLKERESFIIMVASSALAVERAERKRRKMTATMMVVVMVGCLSSSSSMALSPGEREREREREERKRRGVCDGSLF